MKIESSDIDLTMLLSMGYYKIPRFQRPYSWDSENVEEFWNDIIQESETDYFIGSMVFYNIGKQVFGIVDGQQRLTTITILLCLLRDLFNIYGFIDLAEGVHQFIEKKNIDNKPEFILSTETSYPYFQDHIQKWGKPEIEVNLLREEYNIKRASEQIQKYLQGVVESIMKDTTLTDEKKKDKLKEKLISIRDAILNLKLISIKLDSEDDAYIIFETLNTRGKDLSLTDLVKNHLTRHLKSKSASVDQTKIKWEKILETIQSSSIELSSDVFIHHFWLSKYDYLPAKKVYKTLKKKIKKKNAKEFLDDLLYDSKIYRSIHETSFGNWSKQEKNIEDALRALMLFKVRQQTPFVLSLVRAYRKGRIKKKHLEDALVAIEKFHFSFTAITSQRSSGGISAMYASLARRLSNSSEVQKILEIIKELKQKLRDRIPSYEEFEALFPEHIYTKNYTKERKLIKYILIKFDQELNSGTSLDYNQMTIEHLVPQSQIGKDNYDDKKIGQLGNLILVSNELNERLKNKIFKEKINLIKKSGINLPREIEIATDWTEDKIIERTKRMANKAYYEIWKI